MKVNAGHDERQSFSYENERKRTKISLVSQLETGRPEILLNKKLAYELVLLPYHLIPFSIKTGNEDKNNR